MEKLYSSKDNNCLNLIRLLASLDVFYGHAILHLEIQGSIQSLLAITACLQLLQTTMGGHCQNSPMHGYYP